jgi:lipopolysaccharide biosynthesis glycosyltransferase
VSSALEVACAAQGATYVAHNAAMLHSLLAAHPTGSVRIHYMHGPDVTSRQRRRLAGMVDRCGGEISFLSIPDSAVEGLPTKGFTRKATWYRIYLPDLLPAHDRILYLDSDLLVTGDLRPLWETDLSGCYLGAVTNVMEPETQHHPAELGIAPETYFNAGVLLMNLAEMRRDECTGALRRFGVERAAALMWRDQDALNALLGSRRLPLHPRWNCMNSVVVLPWARDVFGAAAVQEARRDPAIRHFEGPSINKPWHLLCERELRDLYFEHRRATPWPRVRREGITPANVAQRARRRLVGP